ncbi:MAG TPA: D-alanyl-D-alanine carboxypeptidase/D-alanyl-D-alanine-endopeptidase, partial [Solirubrobacteraceae bacterium]
YDRNASRYGYVSQPALNAAAALTVALRRRGIKVDGNARVGRVPAHSTQLALTRSVPLARFLMQTNAPSDNFYAETLIKQLGYELGRGGTTSAGAAVVRRQAAKFDLFPQVYDGSGLSRADRSSPSQVVSLLKRMLDHRVLYRSLALTGRSGTVADRMRHTVAQGRCHTKTGTLHDASNLAGYCEATNGHTLAFAILMNYVYPYAAHALQDRMVVSLVRGR